MSVRHLSVILAFVVAVLGMAMPTASVLAQGQPQPEFKPCKKGKAGQIGGAVVGGLLGAFLGNRIDGGRNRGVGTVLGGLAGALAGSAIGKKLDQCEKEKITNTTIAVANDPRPNPVQTWASDSRPGVSGTVTAAPLTSRADGSQCRMITRVSYVSGEEVRETPTLCRRPPQTNWDVVAA